MDPTQTTVVVGMSGGVDSSVTAYLLKNQGYRVIGLFMKNWEEEGACHAEQDFADVAAVCEQLSIPYYSVNFAKEYWDLVFSECLKGYAAGITPNPDILCNREIKFNLFFKKALDLGADFLATGHYCQKVWHKNSWHLKRGSDANKDQSYFLYTLKSSSLEKILFPLGALDKNEVRKLAIKAELVTATKKDSTGICFIGKRNFKELISQFIPKKPGEMQTLSGEKVGYHDGLAFYTIGQRKGLDIGGAGEAWYVVGKELTKNILFVEQGDTHPSLYEKSLIAKEISWVSDAPDFPLKCTAKVRYRSEDVACIVTKKENATLHVLFDTPQKALTEGQAIVFYQEEICLGGGFIMHTQGKIPSASSSDC